MPNAQFGELKQNYFYFADSMSEFHKFRGWKKSDLPPNRVSDIDELCMGCVYLGLCSNLSRRFDIGSGKGMYLATYFICRQIGWERADGKGVCVTVGHPIRESSKVKE